MQTELCSLDATSSGLCGHRVARPLASCVLLWGAFLASVQAAAIWETPSWALFSDLEGRVTYDSNLYGREGGQGDTMFSIQPELRLERRASLTKLEIEAALYAKKFLDLSTEDSVDPSVSLVYAYPNSEQELASQEVSLSWGRSTEADPEVGERYRRETLEGSWEGQLYDTGKTTFDAHVDLSRRDVDLYDSETERAEIGFAIGHMRHEKLKLGLGYDYSIERYDDPGLAGNTNELESHSIVGNVRGDLSPKVTGKIKLGFRSDEATGTTADSSNDWRIDANLSWRPTERRQVSLSMGRGSYFSGNGELSNRTSAYLSFSQQIAGGFSANINGNGSVVDQKGGGSGYDSLGFGASLSYGLTTRLTANVGGNWNDYNSDDPQSDFTAYTLYGACRIAF